MLKRFTVLFCASVVLLGTTMLALPDVCQASTDTLAAIATPDTWTILGPLEEETAPELAPGVNAHGELVKAIGPQRIAHAEPLVSCPSTSLLTVLGDQDKTAGVAYYASASIQNADSDRMTLAISSVAARSVVVWINGIKQAELTPDDKLVLGTRWYTLVVDARRGANSLVIRLEPLTPACAFAVRVGHAPMQAAATEDGYIRGWAVNGPWQRSAANQGGEQGALQTPESNPGEIGADGAFIERSSGRRIPWRMEQSSGATMPCPRNATCYAAVELESPDDQDATASLGCDGSCVLWVNGQRVAAVSPGQPHALDQAKIPVSLNRGTNTLLLKITSPDHDSVVSLRLLDKDGKPLTVLYWPSHI